MRILVPVDFSACSKAALRYAARLAERGPASIEVLHVWTVPAYLPIATGITVEGHHEPLTIETAAFTRAEQRMEEFLASAELPKSTLHQSRIELGAPLDVIISHATHCDLIVAGTHGRGAIARFVLGSIAEKIVRHSPRPVITVRGVGPTHEDAPPVPSRILAPIDFSPPSERALLWSLRFAENFRARMELLHVLSPLPAFEEANVLIGTGSATPGQPYVQWARIRAEADLASLRQKTAALTGAPGRIEVGDPARVIPEIAKSESFDLIAMGTHGRTGLPRLAIGSVAERVVRHAECPVLTVRAPESYGERGP